VAQSIRILIASTVVLTITTSALPSDAASIVGGQLYSTGGPISVEVLRPITAALAADLFLVNPNTGQKQTLASNRDVGSVVNLDSFTKGVELIFGISVNKTGNNFLMGPSSRNGDGVAHAAVEFLSSGVADVGFEDLFGGGDQDYNDTRFRFRGGIASEPIPEPIPTPTPVPEASAVLGLFMVGLCFLPQRPTTT
jgi:hypothetical protein